MPTDKQRAAIRNILEQRKQNLGKKKSKRSLSVSRAMRKAGYSETTAKNPQVLTRSKSFYELLNETIPIGLVQQAHKELLQAAHLDHYVFPLALADSEIKEIIDSVPGCRLKSIRRTERQALAYYFQPDNRARSEAIDMAYRLRGNYAPEKHSVESPTDHMSDEELDAKIAELEAKRKREAAVEGQVVK